MDGFAKIVYLGEAVTQCEFALNALRYLDDVAAKIDPALDAGDRDLGQVLQQEAFRAIHSFLTHTSNVSRLFWPVLPAQRKRETALEYEHRVPRVARGRELREAVGLPDEHVLRERRLRDHLEHFDERLDQRLANSVQLNYVQDNIGPISRIPSMFKRSDVMRWYDPYGGHMWFRGEDYDLAALAKAVDELRTVCQRAAEEARSTA